MEKKNRNISGLLTYSSAKKKNTEEKVFMAIEKLKRSKTRKVNFKTVSELSGVSTTTLYNNLVIREQISSMRDLKKKLSSDTGSENLSNVQRLREEVRKLKEDKQLLVMQLAEQESIKAENERLKALLTDVKRE